jgi:uncharacterized protein YuzE
MKISYDAKYDVLYLKFGEGTPSVTTRHLDDDISLDIDEDGRIAGIEVLSASTHVDLSAILPVTVEP